MASIRLNGEERFVEASTLVGLLQELRIPISTVLVEQNGLALLRSELEKASLKSGDQIEILTVVAGG